jgi:hypothetical protein
MINRQSGKELDFRERIEIKCKTLHILDEMRNILYNVRAPENFFIIFQAYVQIDSIRSDVLFHQYSNIFNTIRCPIPSVSCPLKVSFFCS